MQAYREWSADGVDSPLREGYELTLGTDGIRDTEPKLGVRHHEGEAGWTGDGTTVIAPVKYDEGTEVTLSEADDKGAFKAGDDGVWTATAATKAGSLTDSNEPVAKTVALSDGTVLDIDYETKVSSVADPKGNVFVTLKGVAKGETKEGGKVRVSVTAYRAENRRVSGIKVERSKADGTSEELDVAPAFNEDVHEYSVTLPHDATGDSYTLNVAHGVDADVEAPTAKLGGGASRILTQVIEGVEWKVTVNFQAADIQPDSPAKLKGIFVNYSGEAKKGGLIKDWDPNRLDYTISVGEKAPSPYITAEWDDKLVDAKADGTAQSFVVAAKTGGAIRTYTVTVVRERSWKTAAEEFKPAEPVVRDATVEADSDSDTKLVSAGYEKGRQVHAFDGRPDQGAGGRRVLRGAEEGPVRVHLRQAPERHDLRVHGQRAGPRWGHAGHLHVQGALPDLEDSGRDLAGHQGERQGRGGLRPVEARVRGVRAGRRQGDGDPGVRPHARPDR